MAQEKDLKYVKDWYNYGDLEGFGEEESNEMDEERGTDGENGPADGN